MNCKNLLMTQKGQSSLAAAMSLKCAVFLATVAFLGCNNRIRFPALLFCSKNDHVTKVDRGIELKHHIFLSRYCSTGRRLPLRFDRFRLGEV